MVMILAKQLVQCFKQWIVEDPEDLGNIKHLDNFFQTFNVNIIVTFIGFR